MKYVEKDPPTLQALIGNNMAGDVAGRLRLLQEKLAILDRQVIYRNLHTAVAIV